MSLGPLMADISLKNRKGADFLKLDHIPASKVKMDRYCFADISKNLLAHYDTIVRISTYILHYRSNIRHISQLAYYCGRFSLKFLHIGCILDVY